MKQLLTSPDGTPASRFVFGTMQFGGKADRAESRRLFDLCREAGITHFDTAHVYTDGASESFLGEFIAKERDSLVIASKTAYSGGAGEANILSQVETSRQRLKIDTIDLLYLHRFDPDTPLEESISALAKLRDRGHIRHIGLSNFAAWQTVKAAHVAEAAGLSVSVIQPMYNLVKRQAEVEILPMAADLGLLVAPYSPLGGGLLTGKYAKGGTGRLTQDDKYAARYGQPVMHQAAEGLAALAAKAGLHPATLAVAWVAHHPNAPTPIISGRTAEQLAPSLAALDFKMDADLYARLSALVPAPPPATDRTEETA